ncbi:hypothetical protein [Alistipes dispar]|jgi:hypothetical protein|uniref:hypothetical protein n=1 Tax=Alistipes dispar TaxID=2585119 RepID=UPI003A86817F
MNRQTTTGRTSGGKAPRRPRSVRRKSMLSFRIDAYTHNRLRELAEASGAGLSVLIRALLLHVLEELTDEEGNFIGSGKLAFSKKVPRV